MELQRLLDTKTRNLKPEDVLSRFEDAGWHAKKFVHMGVIALHPAYEDFSLGASDRWLVAHRTPIRDIEAGQAWLLWVYPIESVLEVF